MNIGIIGAGGWGTALTLPLADNGHKVHLWTHENEVVNEINSKHTNSTYLNNITVPKSIIISSEPSILDSCEYIILAIPTQFIRNVLRRYKFRNLSDKFIINVAKGIEIHSLLRVSEVIIETINSSSDKYTILSGPSHAEEVAKRMPTTVVAASENSAFAKEVQNILSTSNFRVYTSGDVIGCEIGGALKNVIAIAAGIIDGLKLGDNTKSALITRGLAEITRLGIAMGANPQTFSGLSGLGDLIVTCSSLHSRNRFVGEQIGKGRTLDNIRSEMKMVAEGISTTESAYFLSKKHDVEMPITEQVYSILMENKPPLKAIQDLMTRRTRREWWW